jgi:glycolate oxidase FAD binding subunit
MTAPATLAELRDAVLATPRAIVCGAGTKPRLTDVDAVRITTTALRGITEYDAAEFTITALAGTPVRDVVETLAERGQHLPFDPLLVEAGATIGGVVAANAGGPGSFRHGGVRDFIIGVRIVDGLGRLLRLGGKVVKNAAGFDVPKFLVGSLGRFAAIGEVTFKVFPRPTAIRTLRLPFSAARLTQLARSRHEIEALDVPPGGDLLLVRLAGPPEALDAQAREIGGDVIDDAIWREIRETPWHFVADVAPHDIGCSSDAHMSRAGEVAWSHAAPPRGLTLRGDTPLWVGGRTTWAIEAAVKKALDPDHRFPTLDEWTDRTPRT